jgi:hypothetical protein
MTRTRIVLLGLIGAVILAVLIMSVISLNSDVGSLIIVPTSSTDADGDGILNDADQCPFQAGLGDGCPATAAPLLAPSETREPTSFSIPTTVAQAPTFDLTATARSSRPTPPPATMTATDDPTAGDTGDETDEPIAFESETVVPATDADELGYGQERLYAPAELAQNQIGVIRLEVELFPIAPTPTYRPPLATMTVAANVTRPPTSTPLPLVASGNLEVRSVFQARLTGVDADKFEIVAREPQNEIRAPAYGAVSWWEWHIRPKQDTPPDREYSLYVIVFFQTQSANGEVIETTRGERLDFRIQVKRGSSTNAPVPLSALVPWLLVVGVVLTGAVIGSVVLWRRQQQASSSTGVLMPRLITSQPTIPFAQVICFVSYARHDEEFVVRFTQRLREEGVNVWRDRDDIPAGASWDDEIDSALQRCTHVLFVASTASVKSDNVGDELSAAINYGKLIVPILLEDCQLPFRIRRNQWVDFRSDFEAAIAKLLKDLGKGAK